MIKLKPKISTQDKFANKVFGKYEKNKPQKKETIAQKLQNKYTKTMLPVGSVTRLDGYWKDKYENFLGVKLPTINIHRTENSIIKSKKYDAHSYAQGINIYFGKDTPDIETVDGQALLGHEITHILQQKYLDMSSNEQMIDPSISLERKAGIVEDRVRYKRGIEESSGDYFRRWDVLPQKSYISNIEKDYKVQRKSAQENLLNDSRKDNYQFGETADISKNSKYYNKESSKLMDNIAKKYDAYIEVRNGSIRAKTLLNKKISKAKPSYIKQKTANLIDKLIYENELKYSDIGQVIIKNPTKIKPEWNGKKNGITYDEYIERWKVRKRDYDKKDKFLEENNLIISTNGILKEKIKVTRINNKNKETTSYKEGMSFTSDADLHYVTKNDNSKLNEKDKIKLINELRLNSNKTYVNHGETAGNWNHQYINYGDTSLAYYDKESNNKKENDKTFIEYQNKLLAGKENSSNLIDNYEDGKNNIFSYKDSNNNVVHISLTSDINIKSASNIQKYEIVKNNPHLFLNNLVNSKKIQNNKSKTNAPIFKDLWNKTKSFSTKFTQEGRDKSLNEYLKKDLKGNKTGHKKKQIEHLRDEIFDNSLNAKDDPMAYALASVGNYYEYKKLSVDGRTKEGRKYKKRSEQFYKTADAAGMAYGDAQELMGIGSDLLYLKNRTQNGEATISDYTSVLGNTFQAGGGIIKDVSKHTKLGKKYLDKFKLSKKFGHASNKLSLATNVLSLGSGMKDMINGEASLAQNLHTAKSGIGVVSSFSKTKLGKKLFKKLPKNGMLGKASKFISFIQGIVGVIDSGILTRPLELAQVSATAIGGFVSSLGGRIGGKVIASTVAAITGGIGALLYPVTSYFGGMLAESGLAILYEKYAKPPILQKIFNFAKDGIENIEENYPTIGHLINGRYKDFLGGMLSYINPTAIFDFVDDFMESKFPLVWKGVKLGSNAVGKVATKAWDITKSLGSSIWGGVKSVGSNISNFASGITDKFKKSSTAKSISKTVESTKKLVTNISSSVVNIGSSIVNGTKSIGKNASNFASNITKKIINSPVAKIANKSVDFVGSLAVKATNSISSASSGALNLASSAISKTSNFIGSLFGGNKLQESVQVQPAKNTIVEKQEPEEEKSFWKLAKINRHQNQPINKQPQINQTLIQTNTIDNMNDKIDELAQKIFRQMKNDVSLEYARVGR